jgi:hypothetical protein
VEVVAEEVAVMAAAVVRVQVAWAARRRPDPVAPACVRAAVSA